MSSAAMFVWRFKGYGFLFCVSVRITSLRQFKQMYTIYVSLENSIGLSLKKWRSTDLCADQIDVITNFAAITNP